jgi:hypothetical protein
MKIVLGTAALLLLVGLVPDVAGADTVWKKPYPNVKVIQREVPAGEGLVIKLHAAIVDLAHPATTVVVSPPRYRGYRTSKFAKEFGAQVALNGGFWKLVSKKPIGHVVSAGRPWKDCFMDERWGYLAFTKQGRAWIQPPGDNPLPPPEKGWMVISGMPLIVDQGQVAKVRGCGYVCMEHPRSAAGISEDGWTLILAVSEGRVEGTKSIRPKKLAEFMIELGAWQAIHLDGGGSSSLYVEALGGMLNAPAEGKERSVINHLGVVIDEAAAVVEEPEQEPAPSGAEPDTEKEVVAVQFSEDDFVPRQQVENPPRVRYAVLGGAAGILVLGVAAVVLVALRRRRGSGSAR